MIRLKFSSTATAFLQIDLHRKNNILLGTLEPLQEPTKLDLEMITSPNKKCDFKITWNANGSLFVS